MLENSSPNLTEYVHVWALILKCVQQVLQKCKKQMTHKKSKGSSASPRQGNENWNHNKIPPHIH